MKLYNEQGQAVYYNPVVKRGEMRYIVKAASGQVIQGRDRQKLKSRTFIREHQAETWLRKQGYCING